MIGGLPQAILATMPDGLLVVGADRTLQYANSSAARLVGIDFAARCGDDVDAVFGAIARETLDGEATFAAWQQAVLRLADQPRVDLSFGKSRHVEAHLFPVAADFAIQLHDVTAEREGVRARDEFAAMIGHELTSPATSLICLAEVLATGEQSEPERHELHGLVLSEGHRLIKLAQDLRTTPLDRRPFGVAARPVDPCRLLEQAIAVARATNTHHPIALDLPDELPHVNADPARVQQVLANLISNAQKYSPDGARVYVSARRVDDSVEVSVSDRGLGIPTSTRGRIFEKFFRIEARERQGIPGSGLGLAICKEIVEAHGGQIGFDSAPAEPGSRFWFTLPVGTAAAPPVQTRPAAPIRHQIVAPLGGLRVLVVDDDAAIGKMLTLILQADAHRVVAVTSASAALERLHRDPFDVVLSDLGIGPGIDGLELCALVRRGWPGVRFVLATGSVTVDTDEAQALGVDELLTKPFRPAEVRRIIAAPGRQPRVQAA